MGDTTRVEPFTVPASQFDTACFTLELEFTKLRTASDLIAAGRSEQIDAVQLGEAVQVEHIRLTLG